jgi:hypothetical protein
VAAGPSSATSPIDTNVGTYEKRIGDTDTVQAAAE